MATIVLSLRDWVLREPQDDPVGGHESSSAGCPFSKLRDLPAPCRLKAELHTRTRRFKTLASDLALRVLSLAHGFTARIALFICALALLQGSLRGAATPVKSPGEFDLAAIDKYLAAEAHAKGRVGLSVAIARDGAVVFAKGYGRRSLSGNLPVETDTPFAIGSVTKQFTSACILMLAEEGKLSVHDKVAKYFPNLTRASDITLLDLMNHVSGYPDYYPLDFVDRRMLRAVTAEGVINKYATGALDFEPGTKYSYSNTGYLILGRVVEKVSGKALGSVLRTRIFTPFGMRHTEFEPNPTEPRLARGYTFFALSPPEPAVPEANGWVGAAGGIYSTPGDLALWDLALTGGKVLKPESMKLMTTARQLADGATSEYGCGLLIRSQEKRTVLVHSGAVAGFNAWNGMIPSTRSALVIMANTDAGVGDLPAHIFGLLLKEKANVPHINGPTTAAAVRRVFSEFQQNKLDRKKLGDEFNWFLTPQKTAAAAKRLKPFGQPDKVEVLGAAERGGMEVSTTRLTFKSGALRVLMYRRPDGIIEQFFVEED